MRLPSKARQAEINGYAKMENPAAVNPQDDYMSIEREVLRVLKNIYDPEIPVNIYELGLIYEINVDDNSFVSIVMTLTAPNCPIADSLIDQVRNDVAAIEGVSGAEVNLTFDPPWHMDLMTEEAKLQLGLL